jgi:benzodiazapine receptor
MAIIDTVETKFQDSLNAQGRSKGHVALGLLVCAAFVGVTAAIAATRPQPVAPGAKPSRRPAIKAAWPALFSVTTLANMRVWNAPSSPDRTRALALFVVMQLTSMFWMFKRPRDKGAQLAAAVSTAACTAAYAHAAAYVDQKAAGLVAPSGFVGLAALIAKPLDAA